VLIDLSDLIYFTAIVVLSWLCAPPIVRMIGTEAPGTMFCGIDALTWRTQGIVPASETASWTTASAPPIVTFTGSTGTMPNIDADGSRQELNTLVDHIPEPEVASARDYLRSLLDPVELALLNAPADDEPMSEHERIAWEGDELRRRRGESPISAEEVLRELGFTESDLR
jgi:hypothetical protein